MVSFTGLSSGIDSRAIIDAVLQSQRQPILRFAAQRSAVQTQISKLGELLGAASGLQSLAESYTEAGDVLAYSATSTDDLIATLSASSGALPGTYALDVQSLAVGEKDRSQAFTASSAEVTQGSIEITVAGDAMVAIEITDGMTLQEVAAAINASDAAVNASIINDGTQSYLQVSASEAGHAIGGAADDAITIEEFYIGSDGQELALSQVQQASNALVEIDGLPIESRTNTLSGAIEGVTIELEAEGVVDISVDKDDAGTKENVQAFLDGINDVLGRLKSELAVGETTDRNQTLLSDPNVRRLRSDLGNVVLSSIDGFQSGYDALSRVGITLDSTGQLAIDTTEFEAALAEDPEAFAELLTGEGGIASQLGTVLDKYTDSVDGSFATRRKALESRISNYDKTIERLEERLGSTAKRLERRFASLESALSAVNLQGSALNSLLIGTL